jgi:very-short-patch-repair endonuclease
MESAEEGSHTSEETAVTQVFNRNDTLEKRRKRRNGAPEAETRLWQHLKGKKVGGCKFRRQFSVGHYILDFYCPTLKLAIEIDGPSHDDAEAQEYDAIRQRTIEALNIHFLRFTNADVYHHMEGMLITISAVVEERSASPAEED